METTRGQAIETTRVKRNSIDNVFVFNKMGRYGTNEIFSIEPFVMLGIHDGWREKFFRIRLLNRKGNSKVGTRQPIVRSGVGVFDLGSLKNRRAAGDRISEKEAGKSDGRTMNLLWNESTVWRVPLCL